MTITCFERWKAPCTRRISSCSKHSNGLRVARVVSLAFVRFPNHRPGPGTGRSDSSPPGCWPPSVTHAYRCRCEWLADRRQRMRVRPGRSGGTGQRRAKDAEEDFLGARLSHIPDRPGVTHLRQGDQRQRIASQHQRVMVGGTRAHEQERQSPGPLGNDQHQQIGALHC